MTSGQLLLPPFPWDVLPGLSIGPLQIGTSVQRVLELLGNPHYQLTNAPAIELVGYCWPKLGVKVEYDAMKQKITALEVCGDNILLYGVALNKLTQQNLSNWFGQSIVKDEFGFESRSMGIGFLTLPGRSKIVSIIIFGENYYDTQKEEPLLSSEIERCTIQKLNNEVAYDTIAPWQRINRTHAIEQ